MKGDERLSNWKRTLLEVSNPSTEAGGDNISYVLSVVKSITLISLKHPKIRPIQHPFPPSPPLHTPTLVPAYNIIVNCAPCDGSPKKRPIAWCAIHYAGRFLFTLTWEIETSYVFSPWWMDFFARCY